jgi:hypothetical protein
VFQLAGRIVANARHEADLMIDENERGIFGSEGFVGMDWLRHWILLLSSRLAAGRLDWQSLYFLYVPFL